MGWRLQSWFVTGSLASTLPGTLVWETDNKTPEPYPARSHVFGELQEDSLDLAGGPAVLSTLVPRGSFESCM